MLLNILIYFLVLLYLPFRFLTSYEFEEVKKKVLFFKEVFFVFFLTCLMLFRRDFFILAFVVFYLFLFLDSKNHFYVKFFVLCLGLGFFYDFLNVELLILLNMIVMFSFFDQGRRKEFMLLNYGFVLFLVSYLIKYFLF